MQMVVGDELGLGLTLGLRSSAPLAYNSHKAAQELRFVMLAKYSWQMRLVVEEGCCPLCTG
jgi:hypothetical protein